MKKQSFSETVSFITILGLSLVSFVRGAFWTIQQSRVISDSEFYMKLHEIMPIFIWGILLVVSSTVLMLSAIALPKQSYNNMCNWLLCAGGLFNAVMYFLMTSASIFNSINWLTWVQFAVFTVIFASLSFVGGANIYERRR